jgi:hypothetical protein
MGAGLTGGQNMRTRYRKILVAAGAALASMAMLASAAEATPPPSPYQDFAGCPSRAESAFVAFCFKYEFTGGHLQLGKKNIPVTNPIIFRGGERFVTGEFLGNSEAGIVPAQQTVEGGLLGLTGSTKIDELLAGYPALTVHATIESAGTPAGPVIQPPFTLPVKVHLENPLLGSTCYIGSNAEPINLNLTTGTTSPPPPNSPISGAEGSEFEREEERRAVLKSEGGLLVDNAFASPGANGCALTIGGIHIGINKLINRAAALPSAAGKNEVKLNYDLSLVTPEIAYAGA